MSLRMVIASLALGAFSAPAAAQLWVEVDRLPGDIPVELDAESVEEAMDGVNLTLRGTFRKELPNGMMETAVAIDCRNQTSKTRSIRLTREGELLTENVMLDAETKPVNFGSAEAIYLKALCQDEIAPPPMPDFAPDEIDGAIADHEALPEADLPDGSGAGGDGE